MFGGRWIVCRPDPEKANEEMYLTEEGICTSSRRSQSMNAREWISSTSEMLTADSAEGRTRPCRSRCTRGSPQTLHQDQNTNHSVVEYTQHVKRKHSYLYTQNYMSTTWTHGALKATGTLSRALHLHPARRAHRVRRRPVPWQPNQFYCIQRVGVRMSQPCSRPRQKVDQPEKHVVSQRIPHVRRHTLGLRRPVRRQTLGVHGRVCRRARTHPGSRQLRATVRTATKIRRTRQHARSAHVLEKLKPKPVLLRGPRELAAGHLEKHVPLHLLLHARHNHRVHVLERRHVQLMPPII